jgi:hypothetical protein
MVFVYTGKGRRQAQKDDAPPEQRKCAKQACAIQWCLAKRDHKEHLCKNFIDEWQDCCEKARAVAALEAAAAAAEVANNNVVVEGKEEQRSDGVGASSKAHGEDIII